MLNVTQRTSHDAVTTDTTTIANPAAVPPDLLEIRDLHTYFFTEEGIVHAIDGLDLRVRRGEIFGLVGESGCGKSVTARAILRLVEEPGRITSGAIGFDGQPLFELDAEAMRALRGRRISMIFQEPQSSFNPVMSIGRQVAEVFRIHENLDRRTAWTRAVDLLRLVGIPNPEQKARAYPHEISGGQAQRVMIAIALALDPDLLIADEPTTALDVTIQAQILGLIAAMSRRRQMAVLLITHDLGVVADLCTRVAVMYAGQIVEQAATRELFDQPLHPYTQGLMNSMPPLGNMPERLSTIPGVMPKLVARPPGCRFAPRCQARRDYGLTICEKREPDLIPVTSGQMVRCWLYQDERELSGHRAPISLLESTVPRRREQPFAAAEEPNHG